MKLAICYSTRNQLELTKQTFPNVDDRSAHLIWCDGSTEEDALKFFEENRHQAIVSERVLGGADAAIAWKLTRALQSNVEYTHIMLLENDVLLHYNWRDCLALFYETDDKKLHVGAVSPRSYVDRILIQRSGYAVMHNIGAGAIVLTREAAGILLNTFRTGWWPSVRYGFAQVSGIDIGGYACFAGNAQPVTTDWQFEFQLLQRGLCCLALTPARCEMIGQDPPLDEQGLELVSHETEVRCNAEAFNNLVMTTNAIRDGKMETADFVNIFHTQMGATLFYPHQVAYLFAQQQGWRLKWTQGHGPFSYVAGPGGASLSVRVAGSCSFLLSGGLEIGANVKLVDSHSGFQTQPELPPFSGGATEIMVPGGVMPRTVALGLSEGGVFYGINCADGQLLNRAYSFTWNELPKEIA